MYSPGLFQKKRHHESSKLQVFLIGFTVYIAWNLQVISSNHWPAMASPFAILLAWCCLRYTLGACLLFAAILSCGLDSLNGQNPALYLPCHLLATALVFLLRPSLNTTIFWLVPIQTLLWSLSYHFVWALLNIVAGYTGYYLNLSWAILNLWHSSLDALGAVAIFSLPLRVLKPSSAASLI